MIAQKLGSMGVAAVLGLIPVLVSVPVQAQVADGTIDSGEYSVNYLGVGARGIAVEDVQLYLQEEGYYYGPIDGIYGPMTQQAVAEYQQANDLPADGVIGPETFDEMADAGADFDDGLFDEDGVFDNEGAFDGEEGDDDGIFDNEGQFDNEGEGLL